MLPLCVPVGASQQAIYASLIRHFILKSIRLPRRVVGLRRLSF